jgi:hypothetical protein
MSCTRVFPWILLHTKHVNETALRRALLPLLPRLHKKRLAGNFARCCSLPSAQTRKTKTVQCRTAGSKIGWKTFYHPIRQAFQV